MLAATCAASRNAAPARSSAAANAACSSRLSVTATCDRNAARPSAAPSRPSASQGSALRRASITQLRARSSSGRIFRGAPFVRIFACDRPTMQAAAPSDSSSDRLSRAVWAFSRRNWRFVMIGMLALLHVVAFRGVADDGARVLVIAHLGLLLLWQPILSSERPVTATQTLLITLWAAGAVLWLNWWLLAVWIVVLAGLVGGRVFVHQARWQRRFYLLVFVYLLALLVVLVLPEIAPRREVD